MRKQLLFAGLMVSVMGIQASGAAIYDVVLNTAALAAHPAGPFSVELQFNDGAGSGDSNNTAILNGFTFGSGGPVSTPNIVGGVSGNLSSSVNMTDSSFFNQFIQTLTPGASLKFQLSLTTNVDQGGVPDEFSLAILDSSGVELPTFGRANAFLIIDINSASPSVSVFSTDNSVSPAAGGLPIDIAAPTVTLATASSPEPGSLALMGVGCAALFVFPWIRRRKFPTSATDVAISAG